MKSFQEYITETPMKSNFEDIYKRKNKDSFKKKALDGELELENGGKMLPLAKDDYALKQLMSVNDHGDLQDLESIRKHIKDKWGINKISDISKDINGFSPSSGKPSGEDWEALIVVAVKKLLKINFTSSPEWTRVGKYWGDYGDASLKLGKEFISSFKTSDINQLGSSTLPTSSEWTRFGATNKTPKTDIIGDDYRISLKKSGGSQLMSAGPEEAIATVNAAMLTYGSTKVGKIKIQSVMDMLKEKMIRLSEKGTVDSINQLRGKDNLTPKELDRIAELDKAHINAKDINKSLDDIFKDDLFKAHFCFEAATGRVKFKDSIEGQANRIVVFKETGSFVKKPLTLDSPEKSGKVLAKGNSFYVSFKSTSGSKPYLALRTKNIKPKDLREETFRDIIAEEVSKSKMLTEEFQQLDEFAIFSKLGQKIKNLSMNVVNQVRQVWEKIMERVSKVFAYIVKLGAKAIGALMKFFGLKIDKVNVRGGGTYPLI